MRVANFRDDVLWAIAHKSGIDPDITRNGQGIMPDQADAWVSFINSWVRRLYPSADYPEWTPIDQFSVPQNHIVPWDSVSVGGTSDVHVRIGRVLKVYLVDPETTWAAVDIPFRLTPQGVHVGYEHGASVWIKYLAPCPKFTAREWDANRIYVLDEPTYSPRLGQCFRSKTSGNVGHDPGVTFSPPPPHLDEQPAARLPTEIVQPLTPDNPGAVQKSQIVLLTMADRTQTTDIPPNPPPNLSRIAAIVSDANGITIGSGISFPNGTDTSDIILTDIANQLIADLGAGWTITPDTDAMTIRIENLSDFRVIQWLYIPVGGPAFYLRQSQLQTYVPAILSSDGTRQVIEFPLSDDQVTPGATFTLDFIDVAGGVHPVNYVAGPSDGAQQVLSGLISNVQAAGAGDDFLSDVFSTLDTTSSKANFATSTAISLNATVTAPGSQWWELVPLPMDLVDGCVRGAIADSLKAEGQADKGAAEEQLVPTEIQAVTGRSTAPQYDDLTDQTRAKLPK